MAGVCSVFERYEKKYRIREEQYRQLVCTLLDSMSPDIYGATRICSLYFDTPESHIIERSLEKPVYKEKLRVRSYGLPRADDLVFIEIKKKFKGIVYKRRVSCSLAQARSMLQDKSSLRASQVLGNVGQDNPSSQQIMREIDYLRERYSLLEPAMFISTWREAYQADDGSDLRVTFDSDIRWRTAQLDFEYGAEGRALLRPDERILEIKSSNSIPIWLSRQLAQLRIYPVSFSKYGEAYKLLCAKREEPFCRQASTAQEKTGAVTQRVSDRRSLVRNLKKAAELRLSRMHV